jgi:hypothetical protein
LSQSYCRSLIPQGITGCRLDLKENRAIVVVYRNKPFPKYSRTRTYYGASVTDATATESIIDEQKKCLLQCLRWVWYWHRYVVGPARAGHCPINHGEPTAEEILEE